KFSQVKLQGVITGGNSKKGPSIHGAHCQPVWFSDVIELVRRDHSARARLVNHHESRPRHVPLHMSRNQSCRDIRSAARRRTGKKGKRLAFEKIPRLRVGGNNPTEV